MRDHVADRVAWLTLSSPDGPELAAIMQEHGETNGICAIEEGLAVFKHRGSLSSMAIRHIQREAISPPHEKHSELFESLQKFWLSAGHARGENLIGQALAKTHNASELDVLKLAILALEEGGDVFTVSRILVDSMPMFDQVDESDLLRYCKLAFEQMKNDMLIGMPFTASAGWMRNHPDRIVAIVDACLTDVADYSAMLLRTALIEGVLFDRVHWLTRIRTLVASAEQLVSKAALEALGGVDWNDDADENLVWATGEIRTRLQSGDNDKTAVAAATALNLVCKAPSCHALIDDVAALDRPYVLRLIGDSLAYRGEHLRAEPWYREKIDRLAAKEGQDLRSIAGLDHILAELSKIGSSVAGPGQWLDRWATANRESAPSLPRVLPRTFDEIVENGADLNGVLSRWLTHDEIPVQRMGRSILDELALRKFDALAIPKAMIDDVSRSRLVTMVRRILASTFREQQKINLIWSFVEAEIAETRTFPIVQEAMVEYVGYDYPSAVKSKMKDVMKEDPTSSRARLADKIVSQLSVYCDALDGLPSIEELRPAGEARQKYLKARSKSIDRAVEDGHRDSIWQQIATVIPLKAGRSSFSILDGEIGEKMHLSSMSHSITIPRSEVIDTVGSSIQRFRFQTTKESDLE